MNDMVPILKKVSDGRTMPASKQMASEDFSEFQKEIPGIYIMVGAPPVLVLSYDAQAALSDDPAHAAVRELSLILDVAQSPAARRHALPGESQARRTRHFEALEVRALGGRRSRGEGNPPGV